MFYSPERSDNNLNASNFSAIRKDEVVDYSSTSESMLPLSEASVVQLLPGPAPTNLEIFSSQKASILGLRHHTASVGVVVLKADFYGFMWWDGIEDCRINGQHARRTLIFAQGAQDGFHATGGARQTMGVTVRRNDLVEALAALRGVGPEDVKLSRTVLELSAEAASRFRYEVDVILKNTTKQSKHGSACASRVHPGEAIFSLLVDAYLHSSPSLLRDDRPRWPEQIVRQAEERFFASQGEPVSLTDLCSATGVSQTTLYRAFGAVCGEPPLAYFKKRRLTEARRDLLRSPARPGGVQRAALAAGLTELGRFSVQYRELFGESPSATLSRNAPP